MIVDPAVLPGLLLLAAELAVLAAVGYVVVRVALRQDDELSALAQGLVVGPALWGITVNFVMYAVPGMAGAAVGWAVILGLTAALAWASPTRLRLPTRTLAGFVGAVLVLGWAALASRQQVGIANFYQDLGLAASIRAGGFPAALPSNPEATATYHYGASLLAGLLAPPAGPDLAFVWELVGVYVWVGFALVVVTAMRRRGSWLSTLTLAPLLLSYGLHTFVWSAPGGVSGILGIALPAGLPAAGLHTSLSEVFWPLDESVGRGLTALPDVWTPAFPLGYALTFVVLLHAARSKRPTWLSTLTLAGLVGFVGLLVTTLAPVVATLWAGLEALRLVRDRRRGAAMLAPCLQSGAGLTVAGLLLLFGGGALTGILSGGTGLPGLTWARSLDASRQLVIGGLEARPGGVGLLSLGPVAVAGAAAALARRDRLVLVLATGSALMVLAWLALDYPPRPQDLGRVAGHARNFALVALLLVLSARLASLRSSRWRYAASALFALLVVWPTVAAPTIGLGRTLSHGVQLANAGWGWPAELAKDDSATLRRHPMSRMSSRLAAYIREHTDVNARVLDTSLNLAVLLNTGRSSHWGFAGLIQLTWRPGPEYQDASHYLEPSSFRRLNLAYVYATDAWLATLSPRARSWLADPRLFSLLARDGDEALYGVRPAFLALQTSPDPASYEALRAVAPRTVIYVPPQTDWDNKLRLLRVASVTAHSRVVGAGGDPEILHLRTPAPWTVTPLGAQVPDLVAVPRPHEAWLFPPAQWRRVWRNSRDGVAVYAPNDSVAALPNVVPSPFSVSITDVVAANGRLTFTATMSDRAPDQWTGQDWVVVPTDSSALGIPYLLSDGQPEIEQWFAGQAATGRGTTTHLYEFNARESRLAVLGADGAYTTVQASDRTQSPGPWMLALRLTGRGDRGMREIVSIVPVLRFEVSNAGSVSDAQVYDVVHGWRPI